MILFFGRLTQWNIAFGTILLHAGPVSPFAIYGYGFVFVRLITIVAVMPVPVRGIVYMPAPEYGTENKSGKQCKQHEAEYERYEKQCSACGQAKDGCPQNFMHNYLDFFVCFYRKTGGVLLYFKML
jgi:hypothetical protein